MQRLLLSVFVLSLFAAPVAHATNAQGIDAPTPLPKEGQPITPSQSR